jgi:pimeloyl-ACP methyl ester carboxylesterase
VINVGLTSILMSILLLIGAHLQPWTRECYQRSVGPIRYNWCLEKPEGALPSRVLYYFHGYGGSSDSWHHSAGANALQSSGEKNLAVVSISFGDAWLLTSIDHTDGPGRLLTILTTEVIPTIEAQIPLRISTRYLRGDSMGGFNASQLLFKHPDMFQKVALVCPLVIPVGPHSSINQIRDYLQGAPTISDTMVQELLDWLRWEFPTENDWAEHQVLELPVSERMKSAQVSISCGQDDEYGFEIGARALANRFISNGLHASFAALPGRHCTADEMGLLEFFRR